VAAFREALLGLEALEGGADRIEVEERADGVLRIEHLTLSLADGRAALDVPVVEVRPGERLLVAGEAHVGKSTLFRALAGLWPWGRGRIGLPPRGEVMFVPQRPYLPPGTLRAALAYPAAPDRFADAALGAALERVGLGHLAASLGREARWDRELSEEEQHRLAVARVLLHAPRLVVVDEGVPRVDEETREQLLALVKGELAAAAVIGFSRRVPPGGIYDRVVRLVRLPADDGLRLGSAA
jgi:putative ATP-binding cassette transporter